MKINLKNWEALHPATPVQPALVVELLEDLRTLYPEATAVSIVGTYARTNEQPSAKPHDLDVLVRFPENLDKQVIQRRDDMELWTKWRKKSPVTIDVLMRFGEIEPGYGQHQYRQEQKLPTPEVKIWEIE